MRGRRQPLAPNAAAGQRRGKVILGGGYKSEVEPPRVIPEGHARCPVCRNFASLTPNGYLRRHRDLFGHTCTHRVPDEADLPRLDEIPEVVLPPKRTPPKGPRLRNLPTDPTPDSGNHRPLTGYCFECGKKVPPMRRLCGKCMAGRRT